ncbi:leucyl aminopeptidase [Acetobacter oeni]|uniref:Probable cytosol aminopeptidase n=1 Tax=Acetobacter oeni TaxID=304077 RepID=A0A511XFY0_9PROT|nr:leucyl aminopeptidase [Acetobacter oeni]MBB3882246.1 leucyl aminopeptidase [Acetobacter oeni]GBR01222.1 leucyl/cytosol aminopeptidase [Acetobacter oeni LMG 21952]GEN61835.1 putative cytosol aminopeptidase [Acetobacter oeni]
MAEISFQDLSLPSGGALALPEFAESERSNLFRAADDATGGAISRAVEAASFTFRSGASCTVLAPGAGLERVVLVGLGKKEDFTEVSAERAGGVAAIAMAMHTQAAISTDGIASAQVPLVALGASLGLYRFDRYHTIHNDDPQKLIGLTILTSAADTAQPAWAGWDAVARGVTLTRDLVTEPANILTPVTFADRTEKLRSLGLTIEVFDRPAMEKLGFGALLGVAQGSSNEPRMVVMRWNGAGDESAPLAFIGKGVTFDSGGISIKPAAGMEDMKWDMGGAGVVTGLMSTLARRQAKVNVVGLIGLVENMVSGNAQRPGDVVRSASGQTIEVLNTDAEGRLVLADVLWYAREIFKPRFMVDLATLTGAVIVALGHEYAGLFSNDDTLAANLDAAGRISGEKLWRMPLSDDYDQFLKSDIADMKNIGGRPGGSITAAQFLQRFVGDTPWAHLDIAGVTWASKAKPGALKGATAFGVRLLDRLVRQYEAK